MKTAVDSSVLLDLLLNDPQYAAVSTDALSAAQTIGTLVVCEVVIAEITPVIGDQLPQFLEETDLQFLPMSMNSAQRAGHIFAKYLQSGGKRTRVIADFLIGAHAMAHADRLLTRDRGFYRSHFRGLTLVTP